MTRNKYFYVNGGKQILLISKLRFPLHFFTQTCGVLPKKLYASVMVPPAPPGSYKMDTCPECHVSHLCRLSTDLLSSTLRLTKISGYRLMKFVRPVIASNGVLIGGSHSTSGREEKMR